MENLYSSCLYSVLLTKNHVTHSDCPITAPTEQFTTNDRNLKLFNCIKATIKACANRYHVITKTLYTTANWYINGDVSMASRVVSYIRYVYFLRLLSWIGRIVATTSVVRPMSYRTCDQRSWITPHDVSVPRYDPCGMPADSCNESDRTSPIFTRCRRSCRKAVIHRTVSSGRHRATSSPPPKWPILCRVGR